MSRISASSTSSSHHGRYWGSSALYFGGTAATQGSVFIAGILLANILGHEGYADYVLTYSTVVTLSQMAQLGIGYMTNRYLAEFSHSSPDRAQALLSFLYKIALGLSAAAAILLFFGAEVVAADSFLRPPLADSIRLGSIAVWFSVVNGFLIGALAGLQRYRRIALSLVVSGACYLTLTTLFAVWSGATGAVAGFVVAQAAQNLALTIALKDLISGRPSRSANIERTANIGLLVRFGLPGALSGFTALPALWIGNLLLARQPAGPHDVAMYNAAFSVAALVLFIPNILNFVGMTLINASRGMGDAQEYRRVLLSNLRSTIAFTVLGIAAVGALGEFILALFGPEFVAAYTVLLVLLGALLPEVLTIGMNQVVQSKEKMWAALVSVNLPRDAIIVLLAVYLIPAYGPVGMAVAYCCGRVIAAFTTTVLAWRLGFQL